MDEHQQLLNALSTSLRGRGFEVIYQVGSQGREPFAIGRHEPDLIARDSSGLLIVGEAKTGADLDTQRSREQFVDFSSRIMSEGILKGKEIPFHIIVPEENSARLRQILASLGLSHKIGSRITIWTLG